LVGSYYGNENYNLSGLRLGQETTEDQGTDDGAGDMERKRRGILKIFRKHGRSLNTRIGRGRSSEDLQRPRSACF
jgi:hypothetical protein